jgi:hypothetical protein
MSAATEGSATHGSLAGSSYQKARRRVWQAATICKMQSTRRALILLVLPKQRTVVFMTVKTVQEFIVMELHIIME